MKYQNAWLDWVQRVVVDHLKQIKEWEQRMTELNPVLQTPGLELDKLIAEKILGWYQDSDIGGPRAWWFRKEADKNKESSRRLNYFSTDIKAAWGLAEKFKFCVVPMGDYWTAFRLGQMLVDGERNKAPTAPHAICLAALFYTSEDTE